jgi:hypothetical protein
MRKAWVFIILGVILISSAFAPQVFKNGHSGNNIFFWANNNLQTSINNGGITSEDYSLAISTADLSLGHKSSEIYANVGGNVKTVTAALNDSSLKNTPKNISPANYGAMNILFGETANKVYITVGTVEKTLQQAINDGDFFIGCYDGTNVRISGQSWVIKESYSYECNCGKSGCSTCYGSRDITKTCNNRVIS